MLPGGLFLSWLANRVSRILVGEGGQRGGNSRLARRVSEIVVVSWLVAAAGGCRVWNQIFLAQTRWVRPFFSPFFFGWYKSRF